jgi:hypothetical protein
MSNVNTMLVEKEETIINPNINLLGENYILNTPKQPE